MQSPYLPHCSSLLLVHLRQQIMNIGQWQPSAPQIIPITTPPIIFRSGYDSKSYRKQMYSHTVTLYLLFSGQSMYHRFSENCLTCCCFHDICFILRYHFFCKMFALCDISSSQHQVHFIVQHTVCQHLNIRIIPTHDSNLQHLHLLNFSFK